MKIINKDRGSGKTTELIHASEVTGFRIITSSMFQAEYVKKLAEKYGNNIPEPMSFGEYKANKKHFHDDGILIDECKTILDGILDEYFGCHVYAGTMSEF